jgi:ketosteroid isomerase-like protein
VFEYPFGYPGAPDVLHGREEIRTHLVESRRDVSSLIEVGEVRSTVYETTDPEVVVFEVEISGTTLSTGQPFRFASGVEVATVHDGLVTHYRDYTNVLGAAQATGRLSDMAAGLGARQESV